MAYRRDTSKIDFYEKDVEKSLKPSKSRNSSNLNNLLFFILSLFGGVVLLYFLLFDDSPAHSPVTSANSRLNWKKPKNSKNFKIDDSKISQVHYDIENIDENDKSWEDSYQETLKNLYKSSQKDTEKQADLSRKQSKEDTIKITDDKPTQSPPSPTSLNPKDFILTEQDWELSKKPIELVDKDFQHSFKRLGERLRLFIKQWEKWERLYYQVLVPSWNMDKGHVASLEPFEFPQGFSSDIIDDYRRYIGQFENLMFPWFKPYYPSLLDYKRDLLLTGQKGIVLAVGKDHIDLALFAVRSIRFVHESKLPIEVWHIGEDDLPGWVRGMLSSYPDVAVRDITKVFDMKVLGLKGWDVKPYAIMASRFREVLFMDADAVFIDSPDTLFLHPTYVKTGSLFYHDRMTMMGGDDRHVNFIKSFVPEPYSETLKENWMFTKKTVHLQESGVVVVDKIRHFRGLLGTAKMNEIDARDKITYHIMKKSIRSNTLLQFHGDKETFWAGFEMAGDSSYAFTPHFSGAIGQLLKGDVDPYLYLRGEWLEDVRNHTQHFQPKPGKRLCAPQLAHANADKTGIAWFNQGMLVDKFLKPRRKAPLGKFQYWALEPGKWELYQDNIACFYFENDEEVKKKVVEVDDVGKEKIERLGMVWKDVVLNDPYRRKEDLDKDDE